MWVIGQSNKNKSCTKDYNCSLSIQFGSVKYAYQINYCGAVNMQIQPSNHYAQVGQHSTAKVQPTQAPTDVESASSSIVQLSSQAQALSAADRPSIPENPKLLNDGQYVEAKKSIAKYNAYQNLTDDSLSAKEVYVVKNNDEVRQAVVAKEAMEQQAKLLAVYANASKEDQTIPIDYTV